MSILASPGIHGDFEQDVLERLRPFAPTLHGCPLSHVKAQLDGRVEVWFAGPRDGLHWQGAVRFNLPWLQDKKLLGNPNALTEITLQILSHIEGNRPSTTH